MQTFTLRHLFRVLTTLCLALGLIVCVQNAPHGDIGKVDVQAVWLLVLMFANLLLLFFHVLLIPRWKMECYTYGFVSFLLGGLNSSDMGHGHGVLGAFVFLPAMLFLILCFLYSRRLKKEAAWSDRLAGMVNPFEEREPKLESASESPSGEIGEVGNLSRAEIVVKTQFFPTSR